MSKGNKAEVEQNATRLANWLVDNRAEFEQQGISEESLTSAAGLPGDDQVRDAIDRLENREVVVRDPMALTKPPRFKVKPGRAWPETRDKLLGARSARPAD
jgi:hypothetical protein